MINPSSSPKDQALPGDSPGSPRYSAPEHQARVHPARGERDAGQEKIDEAFDVLEKAAPERAAKILHWLRHPKSRWVRIPLGLIFIALSTLWFLPVIGIELLPLGLLLIAQDIPFLRKPMGNLILWLEKKWRQLQQWWRGRRSRKRR